MGTCGKLLIEYSMLKILFGSKPVRLIVAAKPSQTVAAWMAPVRVGDGVTVTTVAADVAVHPFASVTVTE